MVRSGLKIFVLSPFMYYSKTAHGGGSLSFGQLKVLAARHEIHFLSFFHDEGQDELSDAYNDLGEICKTVNTVKLDISTLKILLSKFLLLLRLAPIEAKLHDSENMRRKLSELIAAVSPDVVFIQFPMMAQYVTLCHDVPTVLDLHDAFSVSGFRRFQSQNAFFQKLLEFIRWISWVFYEIRFYKKFDVVAALTEQDRAGIEIFSPGLNAVVSPAAITLPDQLPELRAVPNTISFIGSFAHRPNIEAVKHFIQNIFPLVLARVPDARFLVAGKNVPDELIALSTANINFVGFVTTASSFMRSCAVNVVPLLSGGGIKIKTLEALACGCAVVSTSIGAEEIGARNGEHMYISDEPGEFAECVIKLLGNENLGKILGKNAVELIRENFSWDAKLESLENIFQHAIKRKQFRQELSK